MGSNIKICLIGEMYTKAMFDQENIWHGKWFLGQSKVGKLLAEISKVVLYAGQSTILSMIKCHHQHQSCVCTANTIEWSLC